MCSRALDTQQPLTYPHIFWNLVYRRVFGFDIWKSIKIFIHGLGRLDFATCYGPGAQNFIYYFNQNRKPTCIISQLTCDFMNVTYVLSLQNYLIAACSNTFPQTFSDQLYNNLIFISSFIQILPLITSVGLCGIIKSV